MAIAADTWVETIGGRMKARDITPGTYVFGMDGVPIKVKSVQSYIPQQMYYVEFSDGSNVNGDNFMALPVRVFYQRVHTALSKNPNSVYNKRKHTPLTVAELQATGLKHPRHTYRFQYTVDTIAPLQYGYEDHAVPPFVAGMWYARFNNSNRYKIPEDLQDYARKRIQESRQFSVVVKKNHWEITPSIEAMFLKDYATIPSREFPYKYLYGTPEQRLEFLQGYFLVRHKTYDAENRRFRIRRNKDFYSMKMIQILCESLGIKTIMSRFKYFWCLNIKTKFPLLPNQLPLKCKFGERHRQVVKIEPCEPRPCVHIETEKPIAVSDSFIPIWHSLPNNKKSSANFQNPMLTGLQKSWH